LEISKEKKCLNKEHIDKKNPSISLSFECTRKGFEGRKRYAFYMMAQKLPRSPVIICVDWLFTWSILAMVLFTALFSVILGVQGEVET